MSNRWPRMDQYMGSNDYHNRHIFIRTAKNAALVVITTSFCSGSVRNYPLVYLQSGFEVLSGYTASLQRRIQLRFQGRKSLCSFVQGGAAPPVPLNYEKSVRSDPTVPAFVRRNLIQRSDKAFPFDPFDRFQTLLSNPSKILQGVLQISQFCTSSSLTAGYFQDLHLHDVLKVFDFAAQPPMVSRGFN